MIPMTQNETHFIIEAHGYVPEFYPATAYRKDGAKKQENPERQKEIKCPYCGKLFMTVSVTRKLDLVRFKQNVTVSCHEFRKCRKCHENIGIVYLPDKLAG